MNTKLLSVIGSAALFSVTLPMLEAQTASSTTTPSAPAPAAAPAAPVTAPSAPVTPVAPAVPAAPTASAIPKESGKGAKLEAKLARVTAAVGLTAEQQTQVMAIYKDEMKQIKATKDKTEVPKIRDAADAKIVALLTPEQNKKYTDFKHHKA